MKFGKRLFAAAKKSFSLVLAFSIILSVCAVSGLNLSVFASGTSYTVYFNNTLGWSNVYAYMWDSVNQSTDNTWPGVKLTAINNSSYYKASTDSKYDRVIFDSGDGGKQTVDLTPSSDKCLFTPGSANSEGKYECSLTTNFDEIGISSGSTTVSKTSMAQAAVTADVTFYDYLDDQELSSGTWGNVKTAGNNFSSQTWFPFGELNKKISSYFSTNNASSATPLYFGNLTPGGYTYTENGSTKWRQEDGKNDTSNRKQLFIDNTVGSTSLYNYKYAANNSVGAWGYYMGGGSEDTAISEMYDGTYRIQGKTPDYSVSYQGLVDTSLTNGNLYMSGVEAPYFSDTFLSQVSGNNTLGKKVSAQLPFRSVEKNGVTYYEYTSGILNSSKTGHTTVQDAYWLTTSATDVGTTDLSSAQVSTNSIDTKNLYANYAKDDDSYGVKDGLSYFNSGDANSYGFFPFNNYSQTANGDKSKLDYGFGMKLELEFTVPSDGKIDGEDVTFSFTGDDDVWVFIDDQLVLDLGGDHKDATGTINFATKSVTTSLATGATDNSACSTRLAAVMNGSDASKAHKLTMFYMERGLIESNLSISYNFLPAVNGLTVNETVDTTGINAGIKDAVESAAADDSFLVGSTSALASDKVTVYQSSTKTNTESSSISYTLANGQYYKVGSPYKVGSSVTYTHEPSDGNFFTYTTKVGVTDDDNNGGTVPQSYQNNNNTVNFTYKYTTSNYNDFTQTNLTVAYVDTPVTGDIAVTKALELLDPADTSYDDTDFTFNIALDFGSGSYSAYDLVYTVDGVEHTATNGVFKLKAGQTALFEDIPAGVNYRVTESSNSSFETTYFNNESTVSSNATSSVTVTNTEINKSKPSANIYAYKTLDNDIPGVNGFEFSLTEMQLDSAGTGLEKSDDAKTYTANNNGGTVDFGTITYDYIDPPSSGGDTYTITVNTSGTDITLTADKTSAAAGETVTVTMNATKEYSASGITVSPSTDVTTVASGTKYTFTMPESDVTISPTSATKSRVYLTAATTENGTISLSPSGWVSYGTTVTVTASPSTGYKLGTVTTSPSATVTVSGNTASFSVPDLSGASGGTVTVSATFTSSSMLYLMPNSNWLKDSARFAMYVYNSSGNDWADMTDSDGDGVYEGEIPDGSWTNVIFCRMDGSAAENSWYNTWNQTSDLDMPASTSTLRCYTVADGAWSEGSWGEVTSTSSASLSRSNAGTTASDSAQSSYVVAHYYEIAEATSTNSTYFCDSTKYYAVVYQDYSTSPNTTSVKYYANENDAVADENAIDGTEVVFSNYHKGSITISKVDPYGEYITGASFSLYKVDSDTTAPTDGELVETKEVASSGSDKGKAKFSDLCIFTDNNTGTEKQMYCVVEYSAADNYVLSQETYYFTLPDTNGSYNIAKSFTNYAIVMPNASGYGSGIYFAVGTGVLLLGGTAALVYRRSAKRRKNSAVKIKKSR